MTGPTPPLVEVHHAHKGFLIPHERTTTLAERVLHAFRPGTYERVEALRDVSLTLSRGSCVAVIGRNGAGKSTLLKVMAGLLLPDTGWVSVRGSMAEILELGLGFSLELTVQENIELYACILGYPRRELHARMDAAVHFAELDRFRQAKLKSLSTGMVMRLGFATALQADTDILLLDEITAVGDRAFQAKCLTTFDELKARGRTIVLVSHNLDLIGHFCDRAILLEDGRIAADGPPRDVVAAYETLVREHPESPGNAAASELRTHWWA